MNRFIILLIIFLLFHSDCGFDFDWAEVRGGREPGAAAKVVRERGGDVHMHIRGRVRLVVGAARVAGAERDIPPRGPVGGAEPERGGEHDIHVHRSAGVPHHALPPQIRAVRVLRLLRGGDDGVHIHVLAGDEECSDRGDGGGVEEALVLV